MFDYAILLYNYCLFITFHIDIFDYAICYITIVCLYHCHINMFDPAVMAQWLGCRTRVPSLPCRHLGIGSLNHN